MKTNSKVGSSTNPDFDGVSQRIGIKGKQRSESFHRTALWVLVSGVFYYIATQVAWALCFPDSKVSLFFPPRAVLVSILLLVPTRHWWAYTLAAIGGHLLATQQAHWPFLYALHCEAFDAVQNVSTAAGLRLFIKSPLKLITLRDAIVFVLIAVVIVPFGTAFWGAAFTISNHFGTHYWVEWRNLGISNAVTAIVLVPAILLGAQYLSARRIKVTPARLLEAVLLGVGILAVGIFTFDKLPAGPGTSPALLYAPIPLLIWAALRFGLGGTSASMVAITFQAIGGTMHGRGPFLMQSPAENALALQMFLLFTATPIMLLAVLIEDKKRSQAALRESEARFRTIAKTVPVFIWMAGTDKLCNFVNKGWLDFTGRTLEQELGTGWAESIHQEDRDRCLEVYANSFDARKEFRMEYRLRKRDGTYGWVLATGVPRFADDGTFLGYIGSCVDITERREAENDAREVSGKLITAQEDERKRIARDLHDDLNQRLALLSVEMELFAREAGTDREAWLQHIELIAGRVREMSTEVHKLSYQLHPAKLDQLGVMVTARTFCREVSLQSGIPVNFEQHDVPRDVGADVALCLYRVIQEAVQNSVRHSGGAAVQVGLIRAGEQIRLLITDAGNGFDVDHAMHNGGLGLVSMRERVRQVNGSIQFNSAPGKGTRIEVNIPLLHQAPAV